ncbi:hypothetical protein [Vannielia litorea]|uniref:Uncharacterized protein n=1 Tax=Vannielia litorea TaxID=1217970 RepID=A0A1N6FEU0_9RHOB|nr:hypothetical protein [Vannielia litorea]SIN93760.1 hypothetical protein SAMN05444002_1615 [Vannielia litorea]
MSMALFSTLAAALGTVPSDGRCGSQPAGRPGTTSPAQQAA